VPPGCCRSGCAGVRCCTCRWHLCAGRLSCCCGGGGSSRAAAGLLWWCADSCADAWRVVCIAAWRVVVVVVCQRECFVLLVLWLMLCCGGMRDTATKQPPTGPLSLCRFSLTLCSTWTPLHLIITISGLLAHHKHRPHPASPSSPNHPPPDAVIRA
jgi:hypothetical protein